MRVVVVSDSEGVARLRCMSTGLQLPSSARDDLESALGARAFARNATLDLSELDPFTSAAAAWLLNANRCFQQAGGRLVLHSLPPRSRDVIRVMRLHDVLCVAADSAAADTLASRS